MSSRALRKAQRQLEEQQAVDAAKQIDDEESEDDATPTPASAANRSLFALLDGGGEDENATDDDAERSIDEVAPETTTKAVEPKPPKSAKKKKKKKSKANKQAVEFADSTKEDDIEAALRSLDGATTKVKTEKPNSESQLDAICRLLSINTQNLHVLNEMRRLFGREALAAERQPVRNQDPRRRGQRNQQEPSQGFPALSLRRNIFIQGKETWPRATTGGLGMEIVQNSTWKDDNWRWDRDRAQNNIVEYRFVHSSGYQDTQKQYELGVQSMDPQQLKMQLTQHPYHIATLLQVSEIFKHEGAHTESGDQLERALFAFGRSVHSTFAHKLAHGKARLDFSRPENREFYFAVWKYIQNLSMRSTWNTVYEWAKLILSLSPEQDPLRMGLVIDQYALRANQAQHYLNLVATTCFHEKRPDGGLRIPEHLTWSKSLAYLQTNQLDKAKEELYKAIEAQPWVCVKLYKVLDLDTIPPALWTFHEPPTPRQELFNELYLTRAKDLWNTPEAKSLLTSVAPTVKASPTLGQLPGHAKYHTYFTKNEARHVTLTGNDSFVRLLNSGISYTYNDLSPRLEEIGTNSADPWPPSDNLVSYDPTPSRGAQGFSPTTAAGFEALGGISPEELRMLMREIENLHLGVDDEIDAAPPFLFGRHRDEILGVPRPNEAGTDSDEMPELEGGTEDEDDDDYDGEGVTDDEMPALEGASSDVD